MVSEELNSVETCYIPTLDRNYRLVSEELNSVETELGSFVYYDSEQFQKNLIVWKPSRIGKDRKK